MLKDLAPEASPLDCSHIVSMLDMDGNKRVSLKEFTAALEEDTKIAEAVRRALRSSINLWTHVLYFHGAGVVHGGCLLGMTF